MLLILKIIYFSYIVLEIQLYLIAKELLISDIRDFQFIFSLSKASFTICSLF